MKYQEYVVTWSANTRKYRANWVDHDGKLVPIAPWRDTHADASLDCKLNYNQAARTTGYDKPFRLDPVVRKDES